MEPSQLSGQERETSHDQVTLPALEGLESRLFLSATDLYWDDGGYADTATYDSNAYESSWDSEWSDSYWDDSSWDDTWYDDGGDWYDDSGGWYDDGGDWYDDTDGWYDDGGDWYDDTTGWYDDGGEWYDDTDGWYDDEEDWYDDTDGWYDDEGDWYDDTDGWYDDDGDWYDDTDGWYDDGGEWYDDTDGWYEGDWYDDGYYDDGYYEEEVWYEELDGGWYYHDDLTGWYYYDDGWTEYVVEEGFGWEYYDDFGGWYYYDEVVEEWWYYQPEEEVWFYFDIGIGGWQGWGGHDDHGDHGAGQRPRGQTNVKTTTYTDADGDQVTLTLAGPGTFSLTLGDVVRGDATGIELSGTTASSVLSLTTRAGARTNLGSLIVHGSLGTFSASTTSVLEAIQVEGTLASLIVDDSLGDVSAGRVTVARVGDQLAGVWTLTGSAGTIIAARADNWTLLASDLTYLNVGQANNAMINLAGKAGTVLAGQWLGGGIQASQLWSLLVTANRFKGWTGDFTGNLNLGAGTAAGTYSLALASIAGNLSGTWEIARNAGTIMAINGIVSDYRLHVGGNLNALYLGHVLDASIVVDGTIGVVWARQWDAGALTAQRITTLMTTGNVFAKLPGDFNAQLTLRGSELRGYDLGLGYVAGQLGGTWELAGSAGTISVLGTVSNWQLSAGGDLALLNLGTVLSADVRTGGSVNRVLARQWLAGVLEADSVAAFSVTGDPWRKLDGHLGADVLLRDGTTSLLHVTGDLSGTWTGKSIRSLYVKGQTNEAGLKLAE